MDTKTKDNKIFKKLLIGFIILGVIGAIIAIIIVTTRKKSGSGPGTGPTPGTGPKPGPGPTPGTGPKPGPGTKYLCSPGYSFGKNERSPPYQALGNGWHKNSDGTHFCPPTSCFNKDSDTPCNLPKPVCPSGWEPGKKEMSPPYPALGNGWHKNIDGTYVCPETSCFNKDSDTPCNLP